MKCRWSVAPAQSNAAAGLAAVLKISPLLAQCLINRGFNEPGMVTGFLEPRLKNLADPLLIPNMPRAVERLGQARERNEPLVIFGDYDVDGVASTALLAEVLGRLGWQVHCYLPHRLEEGYGLTQEAVENCLGKVPAKLLLAVDCGSNAAECVANLAARGIDTIVLDHHQIGPSPAAPVALVNPQVAPGDGCAFRELCSAGLAFKLAHAIVKVDRQNGRAGALEFDLRPFLDLVALGTIADLVPLAGENRILVSAGLERLNTTRRVGLRALMDQAGVQPPVGVTQVAFQLAPRLNAAGRLENALQALDLLLTKDSAEAARLAEALDQQNRARQRIEGDIVGEVVAAVRAKFNPATDFVIVEGQEPWHLGVVGIVASRVLREFYRPTIIIGGDGSDWRGSGRSIDGFNLAAALHSCADLLTRHGGHAMAAGLSLPPANLDVFRARLNAMAREALGPEPPQPALRLDAQVQLGQLSHRLIQEMERLEPFGQANPPIQFMSGPVTHQRPPQRIGKEQQHLKLWVTDGSATHEALWWNVGQSQLPEGPFELAFAPELNEFNGRQNLQLKVLDWRPVPA